MQQQTLGKQMNICRIFILIYLVLSYGLPTRSKVVAAYMIGLEKTKARSGELSQSVKAISCSSLKLLHWVCVGDPTLSVAQVRQGIIRWVTWPLELTSTFPILTIPYRMLTLLPI